MNIMMLLVELQIATRALLGAQLRCKDVSPLDYCYNALHCQLTPLNDESTEYKQLLKYAKVTCSDRNTSNFDVFRIQRHGEAERFSKHENDTNRMLLWHGSAVANFAGILTEGMKIAPPEADASGWAFGKGVYFADQLSKSLGYCWNDVSNKHKNSRMRGIKCLLLCEVALGSMWKTHEWKYVEKLDDPFQSTKGLGSTGPDFNFSITTIDGVAIPSGPVINYPPLPDLPPEIAPSEDEKNFWIDQPLKLNRVRVMVSAPDLGVAKDEIDPRESDEGLFGTITRLQEME
eukprot:TRINITY_DN3521_c0_g1_i1.p1 TRINITY_DN3521_c0_g1~~TRINITY_DN3521_c0_g1_i1.p1  ORF type:complete len:289 (-),score=71.42 TRINITY_DN3521_c0_g1_i1:22-888(-)